MDELQLESDLEWDYLNNFLEKKKTKSVSDLYIEGFKSIYCQAFPWENVLRVFPIFTPRLEQKQPGKSLCRIEEEPGIMNESKA